MKTDSATDLLNAHLNYFIPDQDKWLSLFSDSASVEYPYAGSIGLHSTLKGKDDISKGRASFLAMLENPVLEPLRIHDLSTDLAFGEYEIIGKVTSTQKEYRQMYAGLLMAENGKIILLREYYNPVQILNAFNGINALSQESK